MIDLSPHANIFDADWYVQEYPDVAILGIDPLEHYIKIGVHLNRSPSSSLNQKDPFYDNNITVRKKINAMINDITSDNNNILDMLNRTFLPPEMIRSETFTHSKSRLTDDKPTFRPSSAQIPDNFYQQYALIASEFDSEFYLRRYGDVARAKIDPIKHYIEHGGRECRQPRPDFDAKYYLARHEDVRKMGVNPFLHYLSVGRYEGRSCSPVSPGNAYFDQVAAMLGMTPEAVAGAVADRKNDLRHRLKSGELGEMVSRASELDPLIKHAWLAALDPGIPPIRNEHQVRQTAAIYRLQEAAQWRRAKVVVVIPWVHVSGAMRIAGHLAVALASIFGPGEVVVVRTETSEMDFPEWFPEGCRHINLAGEAEGMSRLARQRLLVEYIRSLRPIHVFNVNSRTLWDAMEQHGLAMSQTMNLYAYLFCNDKNVYGDWVGYPVRNFHRFADVYQGVICDSNFLMNDLKNRFLVPPEKSHRLAVFETPISYVPAPAKMPEPRPGRRPQIFWAGRFDRQKRIDVTYEIARRMPEVDFHLWGEPVLDRHFRNLTKPDNVYLNGVYQNFYELPLDDCDAWLYTSEWDGVPNVLIEVASAAVPLVGSITGGTGEVLVEGLSKPIESIEDANAYVQALHETIANPVKAREAALKLRQRIIQRRTLQVYRDRLKSMLNPEK